MPRFCPAWLVVMVGAIVIFAPVSWRAITRHKAGLDADQASQARAREVLSEHVLDPNPPLRAGDDQARTREVQFNHDGEADDPFTPVSNVLVAPPVDAHQARAGEVLFKHVWQPNDPLCRGGDGLGPVYNATSCAACHHQNGTGGSGGREHNVTTFQAVAANKVSEGVLHAFAISPEYRETVTLLFAITIPQNVRLSQLNTPALFGAGLINSISESDIIAIERQQQSVRQITLDKPIPVVGRALRLANGQIGRFGWRAHTAHLSDFVQAACANELGLSNPGHQQPQPIANILYRSPGPDLTQQQCDQLTAFVAALPRPVERPPVTQAEQIDVVGGKRLFATIGCADCHTPNLGGVEGLYSDLLLHRMGQTLQGGSTNYGRQVPSSPTTPSIASPVEADEWRTPPLWGVADSAPYLHDGRAATLEEAIQKHGGQGAASARQFQGLGPIQQAQVLTFLRTLRAP
jgi:CxxC motif-containing protein (DUF1111 family)